MKILAIETTERIGTLAAMDGEQLLHALRLNEEQRSAQSLTVGLRDLLTEVGWVPTDVELVAVTHGPGSFTGLRVGITAAKVFAYCAEAEILGVDLLETVAIACPEDLSRVAVAVDAQRDQVVRRLFQRDATGRMRPDGEERLIDWEAFLDELADDLPLSGPILQRKGKRSEVVTPVLDEAYWAPTATSIARLARLQYLEGRRDDLWTLAPRYSRLSAAEEKWAQRDAE